VQEEAVAENLKNILLVMSSQGILVPPSGDEEQERAVLWNETWRRLDRFLPHLCAEIFPDEVKKPRTTTAATAAAAAAAKNSHESATAPAPAQSQPQPQPVQAQGHAQIQQEGEKETDSEKKTEIS
jgi:brefeldin A-resistance guanine nucleotide exchange factor 1